MPLSFSYNHHRNTRSLHHDIKTYNLKRRQAVTGNIEHQPNKIKHYKITLNLICIATHAVAEKAKCHTHGKNVRVKTGSFEFLRR